MGTPLFSIVIPTLNRADLLREALDSVFVQEITDFEVIVVDGGSTDETPLLLSSFGRRIRVVGPPSALGPGAARNFGCCYAAGEYLAFLDSDDVWFPWTLATFAEVVQRENRPCWIMGSALEFQGEEVASLLTRQPLSHRRFDDYLSSSSLPIWTPGCCMAIRRDDFEKVGGFTNERISGEDSDLALRLGARTGFVHVASPVTVAYRTHAQNTMKIFPRLVAGMRFQIQSELAGKYPGGPGRARARWQIITRHIRPVSKTCLSRRMYPEAWEFYRATLKWHLAVGHWKYLVGFPIKALVS